MKKNGKRRGIQHYRCVVCGKQFQNKKRPQKLERKIWCEHVWKRQTVKDLTETYGKGERTIRKILDKSKTRGSVNISPQEIIGIFDATHIGENILLTAREPNLKINLAWSWIDSETKEAYAELKQNIESRGFVFKGVVLDDWFKKYHNFINEKTYILGTRRWRYTHRRVRSAYASLKRNLPFLFTYQKYPELNIPNTTNSLDGYWSRVKNLLSAHKGKTKERMKKIVTEILRKQTA